LAEKLFGQKPGNLDEAPHQEVGTGAYALVADLNVFPLRIGIDRQPPPEDAKPPEDDGGRQQESTVNLKVRVDENPRKLVSDLVPMPVNRFKYIRLLLRERPALDQPGDGRDVDALVTGADIRAAAGEGGPGGARPVLAGQPAPQRGQVKRPGVRDAVPRRVLKQRLDVTQVGADGVPRQGPLGREVTAELGQRRAQRRGQALGRVGPSGVGSHGQKCGPVRGPGQARGGDAVVLSLKAMTLLRLRDPRG
jgi:hypothetical protein